MDEWFYLGVTITLYRKWLYEKFMNRFCVPHKISLVSAKQENKQQQSLRIIAQQNFLKVLSIFQFVAVSAGNCNHNDPVIRCKKKKLRKRLRAAQPHTQVIFINYSDALSLFSFGENLAQHSLNFIALLSSI